MARYIDADAAVEEARLAYCKECNSYNGVKCRACAFDDAMSFIEDYPTADVVPKSEYDNLKFQFDALDHECDRLERAESNRHDAIEQAKTEVAREIFEEIEKTLNRKIARSKPHFEKLNDRDENFLSKWGCEDMGYFKGIMSTCEDLQDILAELKKKYTNN